MNSSGDMLATATQNILDRLGFSAEAVSLPSVAESLQELALRHRFRDTRRFFSLIERDSAVFQQAVEKIAVSETHFFRHPQQFQFVRGKLQELSAQKVGDLRVLSAGCATGEEAYSVAILMDQLGLRKRANILAVDVCEANIAAARQAVYRPWSLRGIDCWPTAGSYFNKLPNGCYQLIGDVRSMVTFRQVNLVEDIGALAAQADTGFDIIFCRNVLMYFRPDVARRVIENLGAMLGPEAWLIPGPSDLLVQKNDFPSLASMQAEWGSYFMPRNHIETGSVDSREVTASELGIDDVLKVSIPRTVPRRRGRVSLPRGDVRVNAGRPVKAANPGVGQRTSDPDLAEARSLLDAARYSAALSLLQQALIRRRLDVDLYYCQFLAQWQLGQLDDACSTLETLIYINGSAPVPHMMLGLVRLQQGNAQLARPSFRNAYRLASELQADMPLSFQEDQTASNLARAARDHLMNLTQGEP